MVRKLFRAGNSLAVAIPGAMAAALGLTAGNYVRLEHDATAGAVLLWPYQAHARRGVDSEYMRAVADFLRDYGPALAALEQAEPTGLPTPESSSAAGELPGEVSGHERS